MIRVGLVNSIRVLGNVLAAVLAHEPDMTVVGATTSIDEVVSLASRCDVLLVSARLPDHGALRTTHLITAANLPVKVLVLGLAESKAEVLQYVEAGAAGYILQDDSVDALLLKLRNTYTGSAVVSPEIAGALLARVAELAQEDEQADLASTTSLDLTAREREILRLIGQGLSNQAIAQRLVIEVGTVKNHVHHILHKLHVVDRQAAADYLEGLDQSSHSDR